jgi:hypothetical protein
VRRGRSGEYGCGARGGSESERSDRGVEVWRPEGERETVRWFGVDVWRP